MNNILNLSIFKYPEGHLYSELDLRGEFKDFLGIYILWLGIFWKQQTIFHNMEIIYNYVFEKVSYGCN